jgi:hypothetical protein
VAPRYAHGRGTDAHTRGALSPAERKRGSHSDCISNSGQVTVFLRPASLLWITLQLVLAARYWATSIPSLSHAGARSSRHLLGPRRRPRVATPSRTLRMAAGRLRRLLPIACGAGNRRHKSLLWREFSANTCTHEALQKLTLEEQEGDDQWRGSHERSCADDRPVDSLIRRGEDLQSSPAAVSARQALNLIARSATPAPAPLHRIFAPANRMALRASVL